MLWNTVFMRRRFVLLTVTFCLGFGLLVTTSLKQAHATEWCQPNKVVFEQAGLGLPSLDIRKTVINMVLSATTDGPAVASFGMPFDQVMGCSQWYFESGRGGSDFTHLGTEIKNSCPGLVATEADCAKMFEVWGTNTSQAYKGVNRTAGSLLGITNFIAGVGYNEPAPVNLAFYWNDTIRNVPLINTTLAAEPQVKYSYAPFISFVLNFWKVTRNLAYGMLSIVMLSVGVAIMLRKKLPPQTVVTAQYALPRIVMAVILITFSYPIGAILASSTKYLLALTNGLIYDVMQSTGVTTLTALAGISTTVILLLVSILMAMGGGILLLIVLSIILFAAMLLYGFVWLKAMMLYVKLIISIIFAPFAFVMGAIPGNEAQTSKWFKSAVSNMLGYVLSVAYAHMIIAILLIAIHSGISSDALGTGSTIGGIIAIIFFPVFLLYGFIQATKVPAKISAMIMGEDKRSSGRR